VPASAPKNRRFPRWIVVVAVAVLLLVVGGPFVYIHFIEGDPAPAPTLAATPTSTLPPGATLAPLAGTWKVANGSLVQYRVTETLFGQSGTATGQTKSVTGQMTIAGTKVTAASFTVDMTTFASTESTRDDQFQHRIMDTADFPTATFVLTKPIDLGTPPKNGTTANYSATGKLTMHGTTKTVTIPMTARRTANVIAVQGNIPITFSDYNIDNPSGGPASVGDSGQMVFVLQFTPA
jgi:polyisoprenoid-binding protein YceI